MPKITPEDYSKIEAAIQPQGTEDFVVVWHLRHGRWMRSIHVFERHPMTKEITEYENTASKLKFKGNKAEVEGSQTLAAKNLYDRLVARVYDLPVGRQVLGEFGKGGPLTRDEAIREVPVLVKREAIREFVGEVYSASRLAESEGDAEEPAAEGD